MISRLAFLRSLLVFPVLVTTLVTARCGHCLLCKALEYKVGYCPICKSPTCARGLLSRQHPFECKHAASYACQKEILT